MLVWTGNKRTRMMRKFLTFAILLSFVAPASANDYRPYSSRSAGYHEWRKSIAPKKILNDGSSNAKAQAAAADKAALDAARDRLHAQQGNVAKVIDKARGATPCGGIC
jgi:hypothetical protein